MIIEVSVALGRTILTYVTTNSPSQDYIHLDDHNFPTHKLRDSCELHLKHLFISLVKSDVGEVAYCDKNLRALYLVQKNFV